MAAASQDPFAERLRQVMDERSITQIDLGLVAGVTQGAVSRWLAGSKPTKSRIKRISIYYDLNEVWLLTGEGQKELTLGERISRDGAQSEQTEKARDFIVNNEGARRVIYIQEHPKLPRKALQFDSATDEDWAVVTNLIQEHCKKANGSMKNTRHPS